MMLRTTILLLLININVFSQTTFNGIIQGRILNSKNNEPVAYATVVIWGTTNGALTDENGTFKITGLKPGFYELRVTSVGFKTYTSEPVLVTNADEGYVDISLEESRVVLNEVKVQASPFRKKEESPLSLRRIGIAEIEKNPGSNRDISRVLQAFPGVASTPSYRNDLIVRGGGASENRFYLDGVEIPNLNHFSTQGASGGAVGIINVDFLREVNYYSSAFPANRGNALSSVLEFNQIDGNPEHFKFRASVGASDLAFTADGPVLKNTTMIVSARRSYLQLLFAGLGLPFLPIYNDFQFKTKTKLDSKNEISIIGLGALDNSELNLNAGKTENQRYILNYLPVNKQWNYTFGIVYRHFGEKSFDTWVLSRNHLNNIQFKYRNNIENDTMKILDYDSFESENKFRYERTTQYSSGLKTTFGANFEYAKYFNNTFRKSASDQPFYYNSALSFVKWGLFGQTSKSFADDRFILSLGLRADANNYSTSMMNLLKQLSPRLSASYAVTRKWVANASVGRYYQLPPYTILGFRNTEGSLINKINGVKFISSDHLVGGVEFIPGTMSKLSVETFIKWYRDYPFSATDSVSLASKGADYGTFGDEEVFSSGKGKAYGTEVFYQNMSLMGMNLIVSYTFVRSLSKDKNGKYIPTSWDNRHLLNITGLKSLKRNWDFGFKFRFIGGSPYTPWDLDKSSLAEAWDAQGRAYPDYSRFNAERLASFHQLDIRVDKSYFFKNWTMRFYLDIQNVYNNKADVVNPLVRVTENGSYLPAQGTPPRYPLKTLAGTGGGTILPTIGVIVDF